MKPEQKTPAKRFYTLAEAGTYLACSRSHIYRLMNANLLAWVHLGRGRRIVAESLKQYAQSLEEENRA